MSFSSVTEVKPFDRMVELIRELKHVTENSAAPEIMRLNIRFIELENENKVLKEENRRLNYAREGIRNAEADRDSMKQSYDLLQQNYDLLQQKYDALASRMNNNASQSSDSDLQRGIINSLQTEVDTERGRRKALEEQLEKLQKLNSGSNNYTQNNINNYIVGAGVNPTTLATIQGSADARTPFLINPPTTSSNSSPIVTTNMPDYKFNTNLSNQPASSIHVTESNTRNYDSNGGITSSTMTRSVNISAQSDDDLRKTLLNNGISAIIIRAMDRTALENNARKLIKN